MPERLLATLLGLLCCLSSLNAQADIVINATRVIYAEQSGEETVHLTNKGSNPLLVQAWLDTGDARAGPGAAADIPFAITPPVARIDPEKEQTLRVFKIKKSLPTDRESLFWFNILEIPPAPPQSAVDGKSSLQMTFRTRIKFFYRPTALPVTPEQSYESLSFRVKKTPETFAVRLDNPSPYYINFSKLELLLPGGEVVSAHFEDVNSKFAPPQGELSIPLPRLKSMPPAGSKVRYTLVNDSGGFSHGEQMLTH